MRHGFPTCNDSVVYNWYLDFCLWGHHCVGLEGVESALNISKTAAHIIVRQSHLMQTFTGFQHSSEISQLLKTASTIALVGLSPKENRPSNMVCRYLITAGYTVYPINPGQNEVLGMKCYPTIGVLPFSIDIINIFRKSEEVLPIVEEALTLHPQPKAIWMQQGISNEEAAVLARNMGILVVMDRCIKIDHENFIR